VAVRVRVADIATFIGRAAGTSRQRASGGVVVPRLRFGPFGTRADGTLVGRSLAGVLCVPDASSHHDLRAVYLIFVLRIRFGGGTYRRFRGRRGRDASILRDQVPMLLVVTCNSSATGGPVEHALRRGLVPIYFGVDDVSLHPEVHSLVISELELKGAETNDTTRAAPPSNRGSWCRPPAKRPDRVGLKNVRHSWRACSARNVEGPGADKYDDRRVDFDIDPIQGR